MSWLRRLWPGRSRTLPDQLRVVSLAMEGRSEEEAPADGMRLWRDLQGDVLSLGNSRRVYRPSRSVRRGRNVREEPPLAGSPWRADYPSYSGVWRATRLRDVA